jgi:hypothetical protein
MRTWIALLLMLPFTAGAVDHSAWNTLLEKHVEWVRDGHTSVVDYRGMAEDHEQLKEYLRTLSRVGEDVYGDWNDDEKLAFLINAYNAYTVELILRNLDDIDSIKDIGNWLTGPWDKKFFKLVEKQRSLDEVEHEMIRENFDEPRIHFAVNCASVGCPALRPEAFTADNLDAQLEDSKRRFLTDRERNFFDAENREVQLSPIFGWYEEDFEKAWGDLRTFVARHAGMLSDNKAEQSAMESGNIGITFNDYDWSLNNRQNTIKL